MYRKSHILNGFMFVLQLRYVVTVYTLILACLFLVACAPSSPDGDSSKTIVDEAPPADDGGGGDNSQNPDTQSYIVVLKKDQVTKASRQVRLALGASATRVDSRALVRSSVKQLLAEVKKSYGLPNARREFSVVLQGAVLNLTSDQAAILAQDSRVEYVERDQRVQVSPVNALSPQDVIAPHVGAPFDFSLQAVQTGATWGLDRLDQVQLPLNQNYNYVTNAANVNAYVIDTGILTTHQEFGGRAVSGYDFVDRDSNATDCNGHGTHVAGTIGSATYGVAKNVKLYAVRVLDCSGSGSYSDVIAGVEWVTANHVKPAVVNMSVGGPVSQAMDDAIAASVRAGVSFVVAAGNENSAACGGSPARVEPAITVGATTNRDARSSFSNYGSCVDVFAPGSDVKSTWHTSSSSTNTISGTSMASPHVAGVVALYLALHPSATPAQVRTALVSGATSGLISSVGSGSPNLFVNTLFLNAGDGGGTTPVPPPSPDPQPPTPPVPNPPSPPAPDPTAPCMDCDIYPASLSGRGDFKYHPDGGSYVLSRGGLQKFWLKGPATGADFDIYLYKMNGPSQVRVASSVKAKSDEAITYLGTAGVYRIKVVSYSGKGAYKLYRQLP